jgi:hypothetical protein
MYFTHARQQLVDELNRTNVFTAPLTVDDVTFGVPEVFLQNLCNSRVLLTAKPDSVHSTGSRYVFYNRLRLSEYLLGLKMPGKPGDYSGTKAAAKAMSALYGLPFDDSDISEQFPLSGTTVTLQPRNDCIGFFPQYPATVPFIG